MGSPRVDGWFLCCLMPMPPGPFPQRSSSRGCLDRGPGLVTMAEWAFVYDGEPCWLHQRVRGSRCGIGLPWGQSLLFSWESEKLMMFLIDLFFYRHVLLLYSFQLRALLQCSDINKTKLEIKFMTLIQYVTLWNLTFTKCPTLSSGQSESFIHRHQISSTFGNIEWKAFLETVSRLPRSKLIIMRTADRIQVKQVKMWNQLCQSGVLYYEGSCDTVYIRNAAFKTTYHLAVCTDLAKM